MLVCILILTVEILPPQPSPNRSFDFLNAGPLCGSVLKLKLQGTEKLDIIVQKTMKIKI